MFKTNLIIFFIVVLAISGTSCRKKKSNTFEGTITELISGIPVDNVEIIIEVNEISSGGYSSGYEVIGIINTDADGNFELSADAYKAIDYRLTLVKENYFTRSFLIEPTDIVGDYVINEEIGIESYILLHIKNKYPENSSDQLKYRIKDTHDKCESCCNENFHYFNGINIDTLVSCPLTGLNTVQLEYVVIRTNDSNHFMQGIYCVPNDTVEVNIFY